ncbi:MAG: deoxyribonuclease IV [Deltaproteobacteria bacterium]|jgi:deoxyribonuclease-4|nr:deoxyribonuclease IV [Deltaproteobacteria bacterium]
MPKSDPKAPKPFYLGCHLSAAKGFLAMGKEALRLGADTFQFFTRNPRGGAAKKLDSKDLAALVALMEESGFGPVVAHAPYTMNPASGEPAIRDFARKCLLEDLERLEGLPGALYNIHPGSHVGQGLEKGIELISELLREALERGFKTIILLETMAGKGSEVGRDFGELAAIIGRLDKSAKVGVCLDTCHVHDAGYDISEALDEVLDKLDSSVGLSRLKAVHVNDSLNALGASKDRHAKIGQGTIGTEAIKRILRHPKLAGLPFILETPNQPEGYAEEIKLLRS